MLLIHLPKRLALLIGSLQERFKLLNRHIQLLALTSISVPQFSWTGSVITVLTLVRGYVGRISTCLNATYPVIITRDPYATQCSRVAIDSRYNHVIVGYNISSNKFDGVGFDATWEPETTSSYINSAIVAYPFDCTFTLTKNSEKNYLD